MKTQNRFDEFSLLKAISIMGLPFVHLMSEALNQEISSEELNLLLPLLTALCLFGPTVFMTCMGFGLSGGRSSAKQLRREGIQFLLIGFLLNVFRAFIPYSLLSIFRQKPFGEVLEYFLISDIYYFVGLFFLVCSLTRQLKMSLHGVILLALGMFTVNMLLAPYMGKWVTNKYLCEFLGNFVYVDETSSFPVLSWTLFPVLGLWLGTELKKMDDETRMHFMRRMLSASLVGLCAVLIFRWTAGLSMETFLNPFAGMSDLSCALGLVCVTLIVISLAYELCRVISGSRFLEFMKQISANIIVFYLTQWILVRWIICILCLCGCPAGSFTLTWYFITVAVIIGLCILVSLKFGMKIMVPLMKIVSPWNYGRSRRKKKKKAATA